MTKKNKILILIILSFLAILDSSYLLYLHYKPAMSSLCYISESFNCDIVNKGEYSTIDGVIRNLFGIHVYLGIPNALLALIAFLVIGISSLTLYFRKIKNPENIFVILKILILAGVSYGLLLIYAQSLLSAWCIYCLLLDAIILLSLFTIISINNYS